MLLNINIKNVALISEASIELCKGLNILSGETGAGKSVILDCINFVLGAKADKTMIRHGEDFCLVSCQFNEIPEEVKEILTEFDIECSDEIVIKRKFDINGNGYIKLNGETITATMLRKITGYLVDVHGQSEHFSLLSKSKQLEYIDYGAETAPIIEQLKVAIDELNQTENEINQLGGNSEERSARIDLLDYQINEIEQAELKEGEKEDLIIQRNKINNLEKLSSALGGAYCAMMEENGATDVLVNAQQSIKNICDLDDEYRQIYDRIIACREEISDMGERINEILDNLNNGDFLNIDEIEQRLEIYKNFSRKYGDNVYEINKYLENAIKERDNLINFDKNAEKLIEKLNNQKIKCYNICVKLSEKRQKFAETFSLKVKNRLCDLAMPYGDFKIQFDELPKIEEIKKFSYFGIDKVEFLFSANRGEPVKPLSKIISGGEMSRFMLALKTEMATGLATYIFDEIDAGISGFTADVVAKQFALIAKKHQVIAISHLPQIGAMSDRSLFIEKIEDCKKTYTTVHVLDNLSKRNEIVRLIGGKIDDPTAQKHAENMIINAENFKNTLN